ncbi:MAG TPA: HAD family hydrolase [Porphyromonadaceae bacterium]|nr:HAD family hydrolase [Porphyromonadaceae bacterium]HBL34334.1 HAD family hydrolase [Porphyromonadaceae bacterium]HBX20204.1 HAD family hydrolase [Porphyromonadaceae bacterium]
MDYSRFPICPVAPFNSFPPLWGVERRVNDRAEGIDTRCLADNLFFICPVSLCCVFLHTEMEKNTHILERPDSLIFDMDGTLWDNVDNYVVAWNRALKIQGLDVQVTREELLGLMGKEAKQILVRLRPDASEEARDALFEEVTVQYHALAATMHPKVYDGVVQGLENLAQKYKLFLLSNCEEGGLLKFMHYTDTSRLFTDYMEHGQNLKPKEFNMKLLKERNRLQTPVYIGDTDTDSRASSVAGLPFIYMTYGFGKTDRYVLAFDSFAKMTDYFMTL